jgi:hypothetical protein
MTFQAVLVLPRDGMTQSILPVAVQGLAPAKQTNTFTRLAAAYRWPDAQANNPGATYTANGRQNASHVNATGSGSCPRYVERQLEIKAS